MKTITTGQVIISNNNSKTKQTLIPKTTMRTILTLTIALFAFNISNAQIEKLSGPRVGFTFVTPGSSADVLNKGFQFIGGQEKYGSTGAAFTTQFGWQWESRFANGGGGITGLVEWIALVGGMEKGKFLPSFSAIIGARTDKGFEFGVGPNVSLSGLGLVLGIGKNFRFGNLNLPINIVFIPGQHKKGTIYSNSNTTEEYSYNTGSRISIMVGFNMIKNKK